MIEIVRGEVGFVFDVFCWGFIDIELLLGWCVVEEKGRRLKREVVVGMSEGRRNDEIVWVYILFFDKNGERRYYCFMGWLVD